MNMAGKMNATVGKSILIGAFMARSSAGGLPLETGVGRLHAQDASERRAELVRLHDRPDERRHLGRSGPLGQLLQRIRPALADPHLAERQLELLGERARHVLGQLRDCSVEAEAGLDAHRQQIERVGKLRDDGRLPALRALRDDDRRRDVTDRAQHAGEEEDSRHRRERTDDDAEQDPAAGRDALRCQECLRRRVAHPGGHQEHARATRGSALRSAGASRARAR